MRPIRYAVIAAAIILAGAAGDARAHFPDPCIDYMKAVLQEMDSHDAALAATSGLSRRIAEELIAAGAAASRGDIEAALRGMLSFHEHRMPAFLRQVDAERDASMEMIGALVGAIECVRESR